MTRPSLGVGVLTWHAPKTLAATLASHRDAGLPDYADDAVVFFQEQQDCDTALAAEYGFRATGSTRNLGIMGGMQGVADALDTDYVLFLENDCFSCWPRDVMHAALNAVFEDIAAHSIEIFQLRSLSNPGLPFVGLRKYTDLWGIEEQRETAVELSAPPAAKRLATRLYRARSLTHRIGFAAWVEKRPEAKHRQLSRTANGHILTDSRYLPWSNQPFIARRETLLKVLDYALSRKPNDPKTGFRDVERALKRAWWRERRWPVAVHDPGLFTHERLDR